MGEEVENYGATNLPWLAPSLVYLTVTGSNAYGISTEMSDLDVKGVCIPPRFVRDDLFHKFNQSLNYPSVNTLPLVTARVNPRNPKVESTIYDFARFCKLASDVNPNIVELLFTERPDQLLIDDVVGQRLLDFRSNFLSSRVKYTFCGFAMAQLKKLESYRNRRSDPDAKEERQSDRLELEKKYGYDTKYAVHLVRLVRMAYEILTTGIVMTARPDREELIEIRNGSWSYEGLVEYATDMQRRVDDAYEHTKLPREVDKVKVNQFYHETVAIYEASQMFKFKP